MVPDVQRQPCRATAGTKQEFVQVLDQLLAQNFVAAIHDQKLELVRTRPDQLGEAGEALQAVRRQSGARVPLGVGELRSARFGHVSVATAASARR